MAIIEVVELTDQEVERLLFQQESHFLDFKARAIAPAKLSKSVSSFANADGGELFVGIGEDQGNFEWLGFDKIEEANGIVQVVNQLCPLGHGVSMRFLKSKHHGLVLQMEVSKVREVILATDGQAYIRRSA